MCGQNWLQLKVPSERLSNEVQNPLPKRITQGPTEIMFSVFTSCTSTVSFSANSVTMAAAPPLRYTRVAARNGTWHQSQTCIPCTRLRSVEIDLSTYQNSCIKLPVEDSMDVTQYIKWTELRLFNSCPMKCLWQWNRQRSALRVKGNLLTPQCKMVLCE